MLFRSSDLVKKLYDKEIDANTINYIESFIRDTKSFIYSPESLERTIYYENEYLYKQEIINLDILFYASERLCKCRFEMFNDKEDLNNILELEKNNYLKHLDKLSKKGKRIMRFKKDKNTYYKYIENMKIDYYNLVDNSKPFMLLVFLDYAVHALNQQN